MVAPASCVALLICLAAVQGTEAVDSNSTVFNTTATAAETTTTTPMPPPPKGTIRTKDGRLILAAVRATHIEAADLTFTNANQEDLVGEPTELSLLKYVSCP